QLRNADHAVVTGARVELSEDGPLLAGQRVRVEVSWDVTLADGHYDVGLLLTQGTAEVDVVVDARTAAGLTVHAADREVVGLVHAPTRISVTHRTQEAAA